MQRTRSIRQLLLFHEIIFVLLIALAGIAGSTAFHYWQQTSQESLRINRLIQEIQQARGDLYRQMKELFDAYLLNDARAQEEYDGYTRAVQQHFEQLRVLAQGQNERDAIDRLHASYGEFLRETGDILKNYSGAPNERVRKAIHTDLESGVFTRYETLSNYAERLLRAKQAELEQKLSQMQRTATLLLVATAVFAAVLLVFSRLFLQRAIARPISEIQRATSEISAGRLEYRVPEHGAAELATLAAAINRMADDLAHSQEILVRSEKQIAQGALVPMLAHNIRNPLASIRASAQVASSPELDEETRETFRDIIDTVDRLERWTSSLLAYLHPLRPQLRPCALQSILDGAARPLQQRLRERNVALDLPEAEGSDRIVVDEHLLEQALYNLLLNAVEASPEGGVVEVGRRTHAGGVEVQILDRGAGMPFAPAAGSFSPGPSTKRFGTGLGIPFAFKVTEALGGKLEFGMRRGGGTRVVLWLPHRTSGDEFEED